MLRHSPAAWAEALGWGHGDRSGGPKWSWLWQQGPQCPQAETQQSEEVCALPTSLVSD